MRRATKRPCRYGRRVISVARGHCEPGRKTRNPHISILSWGVVRIGGGVTKHVKVPTEIGGVCDLFIDVVHATDHAAAGDRAQSIEVQLGSKRINLHSVQREGSISVQELVPQLRVEALAVALSHRDHGSIWTVAAPVQAIHFASFRCDELRAVLGVEVFRDAVAGHGATNAFILFDSFLRSSLQNL